MNIHEQQKQLLEERLLKARQNTLTPPPSLSLSAFSENFLYLSPESSALPGRFSFLRAEFQREVWDELSNPTTKKVVICAASQLLKTQAILSYIAYIIALDPGPILVVQPTGKMGESFSKDRVSTMLRDTPILKGKVKEARKRDSGNTVFHKTFPGGHLSIAASNSPADLASRPIRYLFFDEVDRYVATREGDPVNIAHARTSTYFNAKEVLVSSPTDEETSRIWTEYKLSDQREFYVPCHHCGEFQTLKFQQVKFDTQTYKDIRYECEHCNASWTNHEKNLNVRNGHWRKHNPESEIAGFRINALYSSFKTVEEIVQEFIAAKDYPDQLKVFVNTRLAETWKNQSQGVADINFLQRLENYDEDTLPNKVGLITAGVDVQTDRLEMEVVGWGNADESWSIEYVVIFGDPTSSAPWLQLEEYFTKKYKRLDGIQLGIGAICIDSGHATQDVYNFTERYKGRNVYATKGIGGPRQLFPRKASKSKKGARVYLLGVDTGKEKFYQLLSKDQPGPGYCHFPYERIDPEYYEQLTAERYVLKYKFGKPYKEWILPTGRRNEALDCRVYAMAARESFSIDMEKRLEKLEQKAKVLQERTTEELNIERDLGLDQPQINKRRTKRRPSGYIKGLI